MQQKLLIKFSCNLHINILLRDLLLVLLLVFVTSGFHNKYVDDSLEMLTLKIFVLSLGKSSSISMQLVTLAMITIGIFGFLCIICNITSHLLSISEIKRSKNKVNGKMENKNKIERK